jgi:hypothetical protein
MFSCSALAQCQPPLFTPATLVPAAPGVLAPADYDVDGHIDVAVGYVVLYGNGTGGFALPAFVPGIRAISAVDLGGVNPPIPSVNNAAPELVVESLAVPGRVAVGMGTGSRSAPFSQLLGLPIVAGRPLSAVVADLTGDGVPDLVVGYGPPTNMLYIWIGVGGGTNWTTQVAPILVPFTDPVTLVVADFDDDGLMEFLALSGLANTLLEFKFVNGQFVSEGVSVSGRPSDLAVADLNGDGLLDAVVTTGDGSVVTLLGTGKLIGHGLFGAPFNTHATLPVSTALTHLALGDINADGHTDIVVVDSTNRQVVPLVGDGAGGFTPSTPLPMNTTAPTSVVLADLNGDGLLDIVTGDAIDQTVSVRLNTCAHPAVDLQVTGMEVTQVIQDLQNGALLVAGHRTFVRVHVQAAHNIDGVTARLTRTDSSGNPIDNSISPANPGGHITVKSNPDRKLLQDGFLFELPPSWTNVGTLHLRASVNPDRMPVETSYTNNDVSRDVTFLPTNPLKIELINIKFFTGPGSGTDCNMTTEATDLDLDLAESELRRELPGQTFVISRQAWDSGITMPCTINNSPGVEVGTFVDALEDAFAAEPQDRIRLGIYERSFVGGVANSIAGWFAVAQSQSPGVAAHEIGHTLGRYHVESPTTPPCNALLTPESLDPNYPYTGGIIGGPATDPERFVGFDPGDASLVLPRRVVPPTDGDVMSYCHEKWVSDYSWAGMRNGINAKFSPNDPVGDFLRVSGRIDLAGTAVAGLRAVRRSKLGSIDPTVTGKFHLRLLDERHRQLYDLRFSPRLDGNGLRTRLSETVRFVRGTRRIEVANPSGDVIGKIEVSAHSPKVRSVKLSSGPHFPASGPVTVSWSASDRDGDPLIADVLWSRDGGFTFEPIASQIQASSYTFDAAKLRGTSGNASGVIRVFVRDPVLSASADVKGIRAPGSRPRIRITAPFRGQAFVVGQNVTLQAIATDAEDGPLDRAVTWSSDRDGVLGTGALLSMPLSSGSHVLTARVVDSQGNAASVTTTVWIARGLPAGVPHQLPSRELLHPKLKP